MVRQQVQTRIEESVNSFNGGNSMDLGTNSHDLGGGNTYGTGDGSRPPSAAWMFTVLTWRI